MKLESLNGEKFTELTIEQAKLVNGGYATAENRKKTGKSRSYYIEVGGGKPPVKVTEYEYDLYKSDEADDKTDAVIARFDHYGTNWSF